MELIINSKVYGAHVIYYDEIDYELIGRHNWSLHKVKDRYYVRTSFYNPKTKKCTHHYLHRLILNASKGLEVDHRDNNGLNNRRSNLRLCTHGQNNKNKAAPSRNKTGYKGVHYFKRDGNYQAYITIDKKRIHGGYFEKPEDAAKRYNELAIKYHGEFAYLNKLPNE